MKTIIKGLNYTEIRTTKKNSPFETIQHWRLNKSRKLSECGVWVDGERIESPDEILKRILSVRRQKKNG